MLPGKFMKMTPPKQFKCLTYLISLYITFLLIASLLVHKITMLFGFTVSASTFIFPFIFFFADIIAEVYGYRISKQVIWAAFVSIFVFDMLLPLLGHSPPPAFWHLQSDYDTVLDPLPRVFLGDFLALNVGSLLNVYLITRWKILTKGRFFWIRSIGSTAVGEAIFNILAFSIIFINVIPFPALIEAMTVSYILKVLFAIVAAYPAYIFVVIIKKIEKFDDAAGDDMNFNQIRLRPGITI